MFRRTTLQRSSSLARTLLLADCNGTPSRRHAPSQRLRSFRTNEPRVCAFPGDSAAAGPGDGEGHGNVLSSEGRNGQWPDRARAWQRVGQGEPSDPSGARRCAPVSWQSGGSAAVTGTSGKNTATFTSATSSPLESGGLPSALSCVSANCQYDARGNVELGRKRTRQGAGDCGE